MFLRLQERKVRSNPQASVVKISFEFSIIIKITKYKTCEIAM